MWKIIAELGVKALYWALLVDFVLLPATLAYGKPACQVPLSGPDYFGYKVTQVTDSLGQRWIFLTAHFQYGSHELASKLDQFDGRDMNKAVKEGEQWRKCVERVLKHAPKAVPEKSLQSTTY